MMEPIVLNLEHLTEYAYDRPVSHSLHEVRISPASHAPTSILSHSLEIFPLDTVLTRSEDIYGNNLVCLHIPGQIEKLSIKGKMTAKISSFSPPDYSAVSLRHPVVYSPEYMSLLTPYLVSEPLLPSMKRWIDDLKLVDLSSLDFIVALNREVKKTLKYIKRLEPGIQTIEETWLKRFGSCRDSTWFLIRVLRYFGYAARFTSGYLIQLKEHLPYPSSVSDIFDFHAWAEVFLPGAGWIGLDPTSGLLTAEGHIPLAVAPHPAEAAPIIGRIDPCNATLSFSMNLIRL